MSDMRKWLSIMQESEQFKPGETVIIRKGKGGGVGQFVEYSPSDGTVVVIIKGEPKQFALDDLTPALDGTETTYQDTAQQQQHNIDVVQDNHYLADKPDLQAGDTVHIENLYGTGNGQGYGVFQSYSTDGRSCICNVDSKVLSFPVEYVSLAPEDISAAEFESTGNDGSLSPISYGDDNKTNIKIEKEIGESTMEDFEKWMSIIEDGEKTKIAKKPVSEHGIGCSCGSYSCTTCFPDIIEEGETLEELSFDDTIYEDEDEYDEFDIDNLDVDGDLDGELPDDEEFVDIDSETDDEFGDVDDDVSGLIGKILYIQDMGMSMSDRSYSEDMLMRMKPEMIQRIHDRVVGVEESMEEDFSFDLPSKSPLDASDDVSDLVVDILDAQDLGQSLSDRHYSKETLMKLKPEMVKKIHAKVVGVGEGVDSSRASVNESADPFIMDVMKKLFE